jgi:hypothetical protein
MSLLVYVCTSVEGVVIYRTAAALEKAWDMYTELQARFLRAYGAQFTIAA